MIFSQLDFWQVFTWKLTWCYNKSRLSVSFHHCKNVFAIFFLTVECSTSKVYDVLDCLSSSCASGDVCIYFICTSCSRKEYSRYWYNVNEQRAPARLFCNMGSKSIMQQTSWSSSLDDLKWLFVFPQRFMGKKRNSNERLIVKISMTSPIVINMPTRELLAGETKNSFV